MKINPETHVNELAIDRKSDSGSLHFANTKIGVSCIHCTPLSYEVVSEYEVKVVPLE
jgi:hypothetical protein